MPIITLPTGLISTAATINGTDVSYSRLVAPVITTGDVTVTIGAVTSDSTNLPVVDSDGVVTLEITDAESVNGAVVSFRSQNGLWRTVDIYLYESDSSQAIADLQTSLNTTLAALSTDVNALDSSQAIADLQTSLDATLAALSTDVNAIDSSQAIADLQTSLNATLAALSTDVNALDAGQSLSDEFTQALAGLSDSINVQLSSLEVTRNVFRQPVFERLDLVRGDRYNGMDAAKLTWSTGDRKYNQTPVKLLVFDGEQLLAEGTGVADGNQVTIDDFESEFDADLFRGHPRSAKLRYAVVAGTKETLRVGRCHVYQRPDID